MRAKYSGSVATTQSSFSVFFKLLFRWRSSIYMLVWRDLLWFGLAYTALSLTYRLALSAASREVFEKIVVHVHTVLHDDIGRLMTFILGFFVSTVMRERQGAFKNLPNIDSLAINVNLALRGGGEAQKVRQKLIRYANLAYALTMSSISPQMKKRFPTLKHLVETGLLSEEECQIITKVEAEELPTHWLPIVWASNELDRAAVRGLLANDKVIYEVTRELHKLRANCEYLMDYDTQTIPLVYTQVVTLIVYTYALTSVIGTQFLDPSKNINGFAVDYYVPVFTLIQLVAYMGWLRVAETMINSMGEDDDDFPINAIFDRNCEVTKNIVTDMHGACPGKTDDDLYFEEELPPFPLPYTVAAQAFVERANAGSFHKYKVDSLKRKVLVKRRSGDHVDFDMEDAKMYALEVEEKAEKKCPLFCSCCFNGTHNTENMEVLSVDEMEHNRKHGRRRRLQKSSRGEDTRSPSLSTGIVKSISSASNSTNLL